MVPGAPCRLDDHSMTDRVREARAALAFVLLLAAGQRTIGAQTKTSPATKATRDSILANELTAGEGDDEQSRRAWLKRPEWNLGFMTLHVGAGLLYDVIAYSQDSVSKEQFPSLAPAFKLRDA